MRVGEKGDGDTGGGRHWCCCGEDVRRMVMLLFWGNGLGGRGGWIQTRWRAHSAEELGKDDGTVQRAVSMYDTVGGEWCVVCG